MPAIEADTEAETLAASAANEASSIKRLIAFIELASAPAEDIASAAHARVAHEANLAAIKARQKQLAKP